MESKRVFFVVQVKIGQTCQRNPQPCNSTIPIFRIHGKLVDLPTCDDLCRVKIVGKKGSKFYLEKKPMGLKVDWNDK